MRCAAVQKRLVAWQDRELAPGEDARVSEHLETCATCSAAEHRLSSVQVEAPGIPPHVLAKLHAATDVDALMAAAADENRREPFPPEPWFRRYFIEAIEVPAWSVMAAAAAVILLAGYALQSQQELGYAQAELAARTVPQDTMPEAAPIGLQPEDFRPVGYQPPEDDGYR